MSNNKIQAAQATITHAWSLFVILATAAAFSVLPDTALADSNAIETVFCNVVGLFVGGTGQAIATVAVIILGLGALLGKISWGQAMIVATGIALIFGASGIVTALGADGSACDGVAGFGISINLGGAAGSVPPENDGGDDENGGDGGGGDNG